MNDTDDTDAPAQGEAKKQLAGFKREGNSLISQVPAVEHDLTTAAGEKGSVTIAVLDVVTVTEGEAGQAEADARWSRTRRRAGEHRERRANDATPPTSA